MEEVTGLATERETAFDQEGHVKRITLGMARKMLEAAVRYSVEIVGFPCSIAVVDAAGGVIAVHRADGAPPGTVDIAIEKAWSAVVMGMPTLMLGRFIDPRVATTVPLGTHAIGIANRHKGRLCAIHGGIPIREVGTSLGLDVIGGIGTSGCPSADDDNTVSQAGFSALYD
jgi:uncharacterized protein GlcG (DUF336 family)